MMKFIKTISLLFTITLLKSSWAMNTNMTAQQQLQLQQQQLQQYHDFCKQQSAQLQNLNGLCVQKDTQIKEMGKQLDTYYQKLLKLDEIQVVAENSKKAHTAELNELKEKNENVNKRFNALQAYHDQQTDKLARELSISQASLCELQNRYNTLQKQYAAFQEEYKTRQKEHITLFTKFSKETDKIKEINDERTKLMEVDKESRQEEKRRFDQALLDYEENCKRAILGYEEQCRSMAEEITYYKNQTEQLAAELQKKDASCSKEHSDSESNCSEDYVYVKGNNSASSFTVARTATIAIPCIAVTAWFMNWIRK